MDFYLPCPVEGEERLLAVRLDHPLGAEQFVLSHLQADLLCGPGDSWVNAFFRHDDKHSKVAALCSMGNTW